jgi:SAM-dependent methyltransferase
MRPRGSYQLNQPAQCRLCGSADVRCAGVIPDSDYFAGCILGSAIDGGRLWRCLSCQSMFRHPLLSGAAYLELYARGAADEWVADASRLDLQLIRDLIGRRPQARRALDVGCGSGGFLGTLPPQLERFGVEPSSAAGRIAGQQGVSIVGATLDDVPSNLRFDVITMIDVVEHVVDPLALLGQALPHLARGGCLILSTGDPTATAWRHVFRSRFWYSSYAEHISFPSLQLLRNWQERNDLRLLAAVKTPYRNISWVRAAAYLGAQALYGASPAVSDACWRGLRRLRRAPDRGRRHFGAGAPGLFCDHQVIAATAPL